MDPAYIVFRITGSTGTESLFIIQCSGLSVYRNDYILKETF